MSHIDQDDSSESPIHDLNTCEYYAPKDIANLAQQGVDPFSSLCMNIQSINAHWEGLLELLGNTNTNSFTIDCLGLTEIFRINDFSNYNIEGYHPIVYKTRPDRNRGGIGLYVNAQLSFIPREDLSIFIPHVIESLFIEIQISSNKSIIVGVVYRPNTPPRANFDQFSESLMNVMNIINNEHKQLMLMGDLNIDLLKFETHAKTSNFIDDMFSYGLKPLITRPTRLTTHSATLIDHMFSNMIELNSKSGIIISDISDHFGIFSILYKNHKTPLSGGTELRRTFKPPQIQYFNNLLSETNFESVASRDCPNEAYKQFMDIINHHFEKSLPPQKDQ